MTQNHLNQKKILDNPAYRIIVNALQKEVLKPADICRLLNMQEINRKACDRIVRMLDSIGVCFPVYEPIPNSYKILTDEDIDQYRDDYLRQKQQREDTSKNA